MFQCLVIYISRVTIYYIHARTRYSQYADFETSSRVWRKSRLLEHSIGRQHAGAWGLERCHFVLQIGRQITVRAVARDTLLTNPTQITLGAQVRVPLRTSPYEINPSSLSTSLQFYLVL
jgi:hypothetical protein